jgi:predicted XRE-type DNA-binding protein
MSGQVHEGCGNVFEDLGLPNSRERQAKAVIALYIVRLIRRNGWTLAEAASRMRLDQREVSSIANGRLKDFTLDRLFDCLDALGQQVEIGIIPRSPEGDDERTLVVY